MASAGQTQAGTAPSPAPAPPQPSLLVRFLRQREASILVVAIVLFIFFRVTNSNFTTVSNFSALTSYAAPWAIIAAGETMLLICGEIDLSVGSTFAFAPIITYQLWNFYWPFWLAIIGALVVCAVVGLVNGVVTVYLRVPSFVTTMGMLYLLQGITLVLTNGSAVSAPQQNAWISTVLGGADFTVFAWAVLIAIVMAVVLGWTRFGLHTISVGGNKLGARQAGIRTARILIVNFIVASLLAGFTGIMENIATKQFDPNSGGTDYMFYAVAAAVIGGTALAGGSGTIIGAFLGAVVLGILNNGMLLDGVNAYWFYAILGAAILAAMILNVYLNRLRAAGRA